MCQLYTNYAQCDDQVAFELRALVDMNATYVIRVIQL